ncbi:MAG: RNA-directed DNA polymerase [Caldilineaceae bacterium]
MNEFDHFVTRELGCRAYLRYVDDFLLFGDDKTLWRWRDAVIARLAELRLTLHERPAQVRPTSEGVRFLGRLSDPPPALATQGLPISAVSKA